VLEGITYETRATLESMCYGGLCSLDVDDIWDLFEALPWYQWHHEVASNESFVCPSPTSDDLHTHSLLMYSYCQSFDHDANSYPYYDISNACYVRLNALIETMNARHECFVAKTKKCAYCMRPIPVYLLIDLRLVSIMITSLPFR